MSGHGKRKRPAAWVMMAATAMGLGYFPVASGTAGTMGAVLIYLGLARLHWHFYVAALAALFLLAVYVSQRVRNHLGKEDPGIVVIDEVVGYLVTMMFVPLTLDYLVAGFFLFRFFDILKPWPASFFDRKVDNGMGIVMDDVAAGAYANLLLQLAVLLGG